jgi:hypothetical protein
MFSALVAVAITASPLDVPPLAKAHEPQASETTKTLLIAGFMLSGVGEGVAGSMIYALLLRGATRAGGCGIDVCAELGSDTPYVAVLSAAIAVVALIAFPMVFEGIRERLAPLSLD